MKTSILIAAIAVAMSYRQGGFAAALPVLGETALQTYPTATLYVVATPIGNVTDIGLRALHVLALVDAVDAPGHAGLRFFAAQPGSPWRCSACTIASCSGQNSIG